ncbi:DUF1295-domain-containing protein [Rickenella mellea]|uniref:DUF1295-domain-containing protein n=1 Tax=Rickenella mellea TaxID=50990 RepID=A0A4Y7QFG9_9AGAM|nr:DUF1295-domain-containing protein [Rickenella mellea]
MSLTPSPIPPTFRWPVQFCIFSTVTTYVLSIITGNVSQVDRVWTFLPTIFTAYFALLPLWPSKPVLPLFPYTPEDVNAQVAREWNPRALLMLGLQVTWMLRLSYNTWRRGLFSFKDEDYRWEVLRQKLPAWFFQVVNLTFIAIIQNVLLFMLGIPAHNAAISPPSSHSLGPSDYALTFLTLLTLAVEFTADNQQFSYQTYKRTGVLNTNDWWGARIKWTPEDAQRGFVTRGLWAWSRHPNFLCEQTVWFLQALFPILASPNLASLPRGLSGPATPFVSLIPPIALSLLFFSSTLFTEGISRSKYPTAYGAYQNRVAMFVPLLTPVYGWVLSLRGKKEWADQLVYGSGKKQE